MNVVVFSFFLLLLLCLYVGGACFYSLPYLGILTTDGVPQRLVKTSLLVPVLMESLVLSGVLTLLIEVLTALIPGPSRYFGQGLPGLQCHISWLL